MQGWTNVIEENVCLDPSQRHQPASVLCFVFSDDGRLVWVRHPVRGWEVPGGKIEMSESPVAALNREVFEESGAVITHAVWQAEYRIATPLSAYSSAANPTESTADGTAQGPADDNTLAKGSTASMTDSTTDTSLEGSYKWVYFAKLAGLAERPATSEIVSVRLQNPVAPDVIKADAEFSPIMQDAVYKVLWPRIQEFLNC